MLISADFWSRFRTSIGRAANSMVEFFQSRFGNRSADQEEVGNASESSSLTASEVEEVRNSVRTELNAGYELVHNRLASIRKELRDLEAGEEQAHAESEVLAYGGELRSPGDGSAAGLHRSPARGDLSTGSTSTGLYPIVEEEVFETPCGGDNSVIDEEGETGEPVPDPVGVVVRFELPSTPLTRTNSVRYGHSGRARYLRTPYQRASRVLDYEGEDPVQDTECTSEDEDVQEPVGQDGVVYEPDALDAEEGGEVQKPVGKDGMVDEPDALDAEVGGDVQKPVALDAGEECGGRDVSVDPGDPE